MASQKSTPPRNSSTSKKIAPPRGQDIRVLVGLGLVAIVGLGLGVLAFNTQRSTTPATPTPIVGVAAPTLLGPYNPAQNLVYDDSPTRGPKDAKVTLVEFLDPECEACRAMHPIVKQLISEYDGRIRLVVRYFPLHGNSVLAALATEAAGEQGKY